MGEARNKMRAQKHLHVYSVADLLGRMPNAVTFDEYASIGDPDEAQMHVTLGSPETDRKGWLVTCAVLDKYGHDAIAYHYARDFIGHSLEVLFGPATADAAVIAWNKMIDRPVSRKMAEEILPLQV